MTNFSSPPPDPTPHVLPTALEINPHLRTVGDSLSFVMNTKHADTKMLGKLTVAELLPDGAIRGTLQFGIKQKDFHQNLTIERLDGVIGEFTCPAEHLVTVTQKLLAGEKLAEARSETAESRISMKSGQTILEQLDFDSCRFYGDGSTLRASLISIASVLTAPVIAPLIAKTDLVSTNFEMFQIQAMSESDLSDWIESAETLGISLAAACTAALELHPPRLVLESLVESHARSSRNFYRTLASIDQFWNASDDISFIVEDIRTMLVQSTPSEAAAFLQEFAPIRPAILFHPVDDKYKLLPSRAIEDLPGYLADKLEQTSPLEIFSTLSDPLFAAADPVSLCAVFPKLSPEQHRLLPAKVSTDFNTCADSMRILISFGEASEQTRVEIAELLGKPEIADEVSYVDRMEAFRQALPYCGSLSANNALQLLDSGALTPADFLENRASFTLTRPEFLNIIETIASRNLEGLVPAITLIPDFVWKKASARLVPLAKYSEQIGLPIIEIFQAFVQSTEHERDLLVGRVQMFTDAAFGNTPLPPELHADALFRSYIDHVFPNHGDPDLYAAIAESHGDQTDDIDMFEFGMRHQLNPAAAAAMVLKPRVTREPSTLARIENLLHSADRLMQHASELESPFTRSALDLLESNAAGARRHRNPAELFMELVDALEQGKLKPQQLRRLSVLFYLSEVEDAPAYRVHSIERCKGAPTPEFAYLFELRDFVTTRLPDHIGLALSNQGLAAESQSNVPRAIERAFEDDLRLLDIEIAKFAPASNAAHKSAHLECYVAKNEPSAYMRHVAGVCVGGDLKQWQDSSYLQMIFRDPEKNRCEGGVLMHFKEDLGRAILVVSINPCSTYTLSVNQAEFFDGIMDALIEFAENNDIDTIACSTNPHIRTNRTGGEFEQSLIARARLLDQPLTLSKPFTFSHTPKYEVQNLSVLWQAD